MKSLEGRIVELERRTGARMPDITIEVCFVPAADGRLCPGPPETTTIFIGKPEVRAS